VLFQFNDTAYNLLARHWFGTDYGPKPSYMIDGSDNVTGAYWSYYTPRTVSCCAIISTAFSKVLGDNCWGVILQIRGFAPPGRDLYGRYKSGQQLKTLVEVWNILQKRTTTKPDDLFVILAYLLNFNPSFLTDIPSKERFRAIICSLERLPQSLLYNHGKRLDSSQHHRNRWVPTELSPMDFRSTYSIELSQDGLMVLPYTAYHHELPGLVVFTPALTTKTKSALVRCSYAPRKKQYVFIRLEFLREADDKFDNSSFESTCILIDQDI